MRNVLRFRVNNNECYYNFTLPFLSFFLSLSLSLFLFPKREMKICKKELKECAQMCFRGDVFFS